MASDIMVALIGLGGAVIGTGASTGMAALVYRRERDKFARERLWDARKETYTKMVASLAAIARYAETIDYEWSDEAGGDTYFGSKRYHDQGATLFAMRQDLERSFANNRIIISDKVAALIEALFAEIEAIADERDLQPSDVSRGDCVAYKRAHGAVLQAVKTELGIPD